MSYNYIDLPTNIQKVKRIFHIGDIHIRLLKRHDEYTKVFNKFFNEIKNIGTEDSIIAVLGDLVHSKTELSPELIREVCLFLRRCNDICPTILVPGNHDANLNNKCRLDSITPIVENLLNLNQLHYLKDSGLYKFADILFVNYSVFDHHDVEKYINPNKIQSSLKIKCKHLIGLFHGPIHESVTDIGYKIDNRSLSLDLFDGLDIVLCADIHKRQILKDSNPIVIYPGSLVQQNHGESLDKHGFCEWELSTRSYKFHDIENDHGYYTIEVNNGKIISKLDLIPKIARIRLKCTDTLQNDLNKIISDIKENYTVDEVTYLKDYTNLNKSNIVNSLDFNDINNVEYQNKLIKEFFSTENILEEIIENIFEINKENNISIQKTNSNRNVRWVAKKFEFSNMFGYGENNVVDFSKMNGVYGMFAKNASGKSSIFNSLCFCLFDKCSLTFKANEIMNIQKTTFNCKFNFELDGIDYYIERRGIKDKKGNVKVDVEFYKIVNDNKLDLNGDDRRSTNDVIRDYIGTYDDFILTSLSLQGGKSVSFIDMGQSEKKDLLIKFIGIDLFDLLFEKGSDQLKEISYKLKNYNREYIIEEINSSKTNIIYFSEQIKSLEQKKSILIENLNSLTNLIENENKNIINVTYNPKKSIEMLNKEKEDFIIKGNVIRDDILNIKTQANKLLLELKNDETNLKELNDKNIIDGYEKYKIILSNIKDLEHSLDKEKLQTSLKIDKLKKLESHKYDPNCECCINNVFVKDAIHTKNELANDKNRIYSIISNLNELKNSISQFENIEMEYSKLTKLNNNISNKKQSLLTLKNSILSKENLLQRNESDLKNVLNDIKYYLDNENNIKNNILTESKIKDLKNKRISLKNELDSIISSIHSFDSKKINLESQVIKLDSDIKILEKLEKQRDSYNLYLRSISRNGIPKILINSTIPKIINEVNSILSPLVDFTLDISIEDKTIDTNIVYDDEKWPLDLASGMEKFISSLTLRCAISNICNLPKCNFLVIDEGFGQLDNDHMTSIGSLFNYLKNQFDFIVIISHLDIMRDLVDNQLDVKKEGDFSSIQYL